jgi:hypothetical protein
MVLLLCCIPNSIPVLSSSNTSNKIFLKTIVEPGPCASGSSENWLTCCYVQVCTETIAKQ